MTEREADALRRLKQDLDEVDWPEPELLARYATDPNRLSEAEKQTVERALAASKQVADELATLRGFDFAALDADRRAAHEPIARRVSEPDGGGGEGGGGLAARLLAWLARPPVWAGAAAALAFALWLASSERAPVPSSLPEEGSRLAERAAEPQIEPPAAAVPTQTPATPRTPTRPEREQGREIAVARVEPSPTATPSEAEEIRGAQPSIVPPPPSTPPTVSPPTEPSAAQPEAKPELLLAMAMPDYHPAYGVEPLGGGEWIVRGGAEGAPRITVLAPDHVTRACSAQPTLHWSLDRVPGSGTFFLTIVDEHDEPIVLDRALPPPAQAGVQRVDLAAQGLRLPVARTLRWSIALRADEASPPEAFDFGWLRVEPPDATDEAALAAKAESGRAAALAALGCYSEALEVALATREARPDDPAPRRALARLAEQAGLAPRQVGE